MEVAEVHKESLKEGAKSGIVSLLLSNGFTRGTQVHGEKPQRIPQRDGSRRRRSTSRQSYPAGSVIDPLIRWPSTRSLRWTRGTPCSRFPRIQISPTSWRISAPNKR